MVCKLTGFALKIVSRFRAARLSFSHGQVLLGACAWAHVYVCARARLCVCARARARARARVWCIRQAKTLQPQNPLQCRGCRFVKTSSKTDRTVKDSQRHRQGQPLLVTEPVWYLTPRALKGPTWTDTELRFKIAFSGSSRHSKRQQQQTPGNSNIKVQRRDCRRRQKDEN